MEERDNCSHGGQPEGIPSNLRPPPLIPQANEIIYCTKCGQQNLENNFKCTRCGFQLHGPAQPQYVGMDDNTMGGLIPYKNAQSLWAYYLGVFALIPCVGIPLGIAALILGLRALKYADLHPETQGRVHAWTGIVLGSLCALGYTLLLAVPIVMSVSK
jgi:hypothetical protein